MVGTNIASQTREVTSFNVALNAGNTDSAAITLVGEEKVHEASPYSCIYYLSHTILGSGMLGLPYAMSHTGWILGSFLLLLCSFLSSFALHLLAVCALKEKGPSSFYTISKNTVPKFSLLIDVAVAIKCFGVATTHLIVIGDMMPDAMRFFNASGSLVHRPMWTLLGCVIVSPLSFYRNLFSLKFVSMFAIMLVMFLTLVVMLYASNIESLDPCKDNNDINCSGNTAKIVSSLDTLRVLGILIFGFTCHQNIFAVKNEIVDPSPWRINIVIACAISATLTLYFIFSLSGYATFGDNCESDILRNYPETLLTSVLRILVAVLVATSYPLQVHPARKCMSSLSAKLIALYNAKGSESVDETLRQFSSLEDDNPSTSRLSSKLFIQIRYVAFTICFIGLTVLTALMIHDLNIILSLVGVTGSTIVSYILPGFLYYATFKNEAPLWKSRMALALGFIGILIMPVCLAFIFA